MTVWFKADWNAYEAGDIANLPASVEAELVASGLAIYQSRVATVNAAGTALVDQVSGNDIPLRKVGSTLCVIGDSFASQGYRIDAAGTVYSYYRGGCIVHALEIALQPFDTIVNYGVAGKTAAEVRAEQLPSALASGAGVSVILCGFNTINNADANALVGGVNAADVAYADIRYMVEQLRKFGIIPVIASHPMPYAALTTTGGTWGTVTAKRQALFRLNRMLSEIPYLYGDVEYCPVAETLANPATGYTRSAGQYGAVTNLLSDNTHYSSEGASWAGEAIAPALLRANNRPSALLSNNQPVAWDGTTEGDGLLIKNGRMIGSSGVAPDVLAGVDATQGWDKDQWGKYSGTGTYDLRKKARSGVGEWQQMTVNAPGLTTNGVGIQKESVLNRNNHPSVLSWAPGDTMFVEAEVETATSDDVPNMVYALTSANPIAIQIGLYTSDNPFTANTWSLSTVDGTPVYERPKARAIVRCPDVVMPANTVRIFAYARIKGGVGTMWVDRVRLRNRTAEASS